MERQLAEHKTEPDKPDRRVKTDIRPISSHVTHDKKFYILIILTIRMDRIEHLKNQDSSHQRIHFSICHSLPFGRYGFDKSSTVCQFSVRRKKLKNIYIK